MPKSIQPIIEELFAVEQPGGRRLDFTWRLIRRKHRPFLLLPDAADMRVSLELYSAQRRRAKIWRALLPLALRSPGASAFKKISFQPDAGSELIRFVAEQSGVPVDQLQAPAIKFGGLELQKSRLVLLLCDETNRPVRVVKLGLNAEGRAATEQEADLLEKLPADKLGCIRLAGRLTTAKMSAFATAYYPGQSPEDDAGLETLFHSWLNPGVPVPINGLDSWRELDTKVAAAAPEEWSALRPALAGKTLRTTLYHGDFAPWNIRAINSQNLQAFDWERGHLQGIPGWDWFHFIVQTSTLARRHSVERVAAEVEQLFQSPRFEKYAAAAGISEIVKPLMLAYLLHHRWVVQPLEGGRTVMELHELLSQRWQMNPRPELSAAGKKSPATSTAEAPGLWADALRQLKSATHQLRNLFWEPTLNSKMRPTMAAQFSAHWPVIFLAGLLLVAIAATHAFTSTHLILLPFYLVPILLLTLKVDRRWGALIATVAAVVGPLIQSYRDTEFHHLDVGLWNVVMRFITLQMCVLFVDRIQKQRKTLFDPSPARAPAAKFSEHWAVLAASGLLFAAIFALDYITNPHLNFIPVYLLPCMIITLALNFRWGMIATVLSAAAGSLSEYLSNPGYHLAEVFGWNFLMRLAISALVILLLERIRRENVLFFSSRNPGHASPPGN